MGTNYYVLKNKCDKCGQPEDGKRIHIGKSSFGWKFKFNANEGLTDSFQKMKSFLEENQDHIYNEYDDKVDLKDLLEKIEYCQKGIDLKQYWEMDPSRNTFKADHKDKEFYCPDGKLFSRYSEFF